MANKQVLGLIVISLSLIILINPVSARIGFGMTNELSEITMGPEMTQACITYYIYNPGDVDIEGYLEIDRESGGTLNKILGIDSLYSQLSDLEAQTLILENEYNEAVSHGDSTYDVEVKQAELSGKINAINERVAKITKSDKIVIPALTKSKDADGKYQIPIQFCFNRPMKKYLFFWDVQDNDYCGVYQGEVIGKYNPLADGLSGTGSAILGSRSAQLKLIVKCDVGERRGIIITAILIPLAFIIIISLLFRKWSKSKKNKQKNMETPTNYDSTQ